MSYGNNPNAIGLLSKVDDVRKPADQTEPDLSPFVDRASTRRADDLLHCLLDIEPELT